MFVLQVTCITNHVYNYADNNESTAGADVDMSSAMTQRVHKSTIVRKYRSPLGQFTSYLERSEVTTNSEVRPHAWK